MSSETNMQHNQMPPQYQYIPQQQQQQQYYQPQNQNSVILQTQTNNDAQIMPYRQDDSYITGFREISQDKQISLKQDPNCCKCIVCSWCPKYSFHKNVLDREIGEELYKVTPTQNFLCFNYYIEMKNENGSFLQTKRVTPRWCCYFCSRICPCCCCCLACCAGQSYYDSNGSGVFGKVRQPCCACIAQYFCLEGRYVDIGVNQKYWIGKNRKEFCCGGDHVSLQDIWDADRNQRLGTIYNYSRGNCCTQVNACDTLIPCCCAKGITSCLCCVRHWRKIIFPDNIPLQDKIMILSGVTSGLGEDEGCCFPRAVKGCSCLMPCC